jgi:hypothetical protein
MAVCLQLASGLRVKSMARTNGAVAGFTLYKGLKLCGLVVRVPGYSPRDPGTIPGAIRFSKKWWVWNGVHSAS